MTRDEAAAILGVNQHATPAEVQQAFRRAVKLNHPDAAGRAAMSVDLGDVAAARDVLLARRAPTAPKAEAPPKRSTPPKATPPKSTGPKSSPPQPVAPPGTVASGPSSAWLAVAAGLFGVIVLFLVVLTVIALAFGTEGDRDPNRLDGGVSGTLNECVVVRAASVAVRPCSTLNAQRIDSTIAGPGRCPSGTNTLDVGDTTYCLRPVNG